MIFLREQICGKVFIESFVGLIFVHPIVVEQWNCLKFPVLLVLGHSPLNIVPVGQGVHFASHGSPKMQQDVKMETAQARSILDIGPFLSIKHTHATHEHSSQTPQRFCKFETWSNTVIYSQYLNIHTD